MGVPTDPGFWGPAFTFLTALVGASRWLLKVTFVYSQKANVQKARLDSDVQRMKDDHLQKTLLALKEIVDRILPVIEAHTKKLEDIDRIHTDTIAMMSDLKTQYSTFHMKIETVHAGGNLLMNRLDKIETEIIDLKNGNILVRTKK